MSFAMLHGWGDPSVPRHLHLGFTSWISLSCLKRSNNNKKLFHHILKVHTNPQPSKVCAEGEKLLLQQADNYVHHDGVFLQPNFLNPCPFPSETNVSRSPFFRSSEMLIISLQFFSGRPVIWLTCTDNSNSAATGTSPTGLCIRTAPDRDISREHDIPMHASFRIVSFHLWTTSAVIWAARRRAFSTSSRDDIRAADAFKSGPVRCHGMLLLLLQSTAVLTHFTHPHSFPTSY